MRESPGLCRREVVVAALAGIALAAVMTWPLVASLSTGIAKDLGDPLLQTWQVAWIGHALLERPLDLWQANTFWPYEDTLAFTDALIGYAPAGLIAQSGPVAALTIYNLLFLFAYALAFVAAYLLARELGTRRLGGIAAAVAFAYAPWKLTQNGHLHVISAGGLVLALFLLVRGYRRESPVLVLAGWLVAAWQMTLGFTLGLQLAYLLAVLAVLFAVALVRRGVHRDRRLVGVTLVGGAVLLATTALMARPYFRVVEAFPEAQRTPEYVESFSPRLRSFLSAPSQSWLWGDASYRARAPLPAPDEMSLFPGMTISLLALVGVFASVYSQRLRIGLAVAVALCALLSLGVRDVEGLERYVTPFRLLYDFLPGWDAVRTPGRLNTLTSLGLALLAGAGLQAVVGRLRAFFETSGRAAVRMVPGVAAVLVVGAVLVEGLGPLETPTVPRVPAAQAAARPPIFHLPAGFVDDSTYSYWSTDGFPAIVNGAGGFDPDEYDRLRKTAAAFPDAESVAALRDLGVRTVLLHRERAAGTFWEEVATRPVAGLGVEREEIGETVIFQLEPALAP